MQASTYLKDCIVKVWPATYAVVRTTTIPEDFVAVLKDYQETTVILDEVRLSGLSYEKAEKNWKILSFETVLPFELVGFLAAVATVLATEKISIFALSAYSTDHIMVKADKLEQTQKALEKLGCIWKE